MNSRVCDRCGWLYRPNHAPQRICNDCLRSLEKQSKVERNPINIKDIMRHKYWALQMKWSIEDGG